MDTSPDSYRDNSDQALLRRNPFVVRLYDQQTINNKIQIVFMDRRESLKLIATGAVAVPAVIAGCNTDDKKVEVTVAAEPKFDLDRRGRCLSGHRCQLAQRGRTDDRFVQSFQIRRLDRWKS